MPLSDYPPYQLANLRRTIAANVPHKTLRDLINRARFGDKAALSDECLYVATHDITRQFNPTEHPGTPRLRRRHSGLIKSGDWDLAHKPIIPNRIERAMRARLVDGTPWHNTELFEHAREQIARKGFFDECHTMEDVRARYERMDRIAEVVRRSGRLLERPQTEEYFRREHGGILVHIARDGGVMRSGGGQHRFALARVLDLPEIPIQVGVVHRDAVDAGFVSPMRQSRL